MQSALRPAGEQARAVERLFLLFLLVSAVVWIGVTLVLLAGVLRRRAPSSAPLSLDAREERRAGLLVAAGTVATAAVIFALSVVSYVAQSRVFAKTPTALGVRIVGHQWWWEAQYDASDGDPGFVVANEIHVPVGKPVRLRLDTGDVIHSFWAPSLAGKMDLINGQTNELEFTVGRAGVYRGQCAEFCGRQHAFMGFEIVAAPPELFDAWRAGQARPATAHAQSEGARVFQSRCGACHAVRGTPAAGQAGPDLTHLASRRTIAAARLPRTRATLAAWIADPQHLKPGAYMPATRLDAPDFNSLLDYLEALE